MKELVLQRKSWQVSVTATVKPITLLLKTLAARQRQFSGGTVATLSHIYDTSAVKSKGC
jgi:hypothetical protein